MGQHHPPHAALAEYAMISPIAGCWRTKISSGVGTGGCVMDVPRSGPSVMATFSDGCPRPASWHAGQRFRRSAVAMGGGNACATGIFRIDTPPRTNVTTCPPRDSRPFSETTLACELVAEHHAPSNGMTAGERRSTECGHAEHSFRSFNKN